MHEIELKFQVPAARRRAVESAVAGRTPVAPLRLQAAYVDTAGTALAKAALALRMRREGGQWVQTLKGAGPDGMTRQEHNVPLPGRGAALPAVDPARHAGTPVGEALHGVLAAAPDTALQVRYRTDIRRRTRVLRTPGGSVELAFDAGRITADGRHLAVCELEIELVRGAPQAVLDVARRWVARHGLWLDLRSKAERGELLARGDAMVPPSGARPPTLSARQAPAAARRAVLRACADQVLVNASQVADGHYAPEHLHQLRVGLRRLRAALALLPSEPRPDPLAEGATTLFRRLGGARDADVLRAGLGGELQSARTAAGLVGAPWLPELPVAADPVAVVRDPLAQGFFLDLLAAGLEPAEASPGDAAPLRRVIGGRLAHWHRAVRADLESFARLDDPQRHRLRKRLKRLRYAVEFGAGLFEARPVRRHLKALRALLDRLGALNDVVVALDAARSSPQAGTADAGFTLGWLVARREALVDAALPACTVVAEAPRFWTRD